eukprot:scaffold1584_cov259-Pinguiococcus_pyrenoidosus.AAC.8
MSRSDRLLHACKAVLSQDALELLLESHDGAGSGEAQQRVDLHDRRSGDDLLKGVRARADTADPDQRQLPLGDARLWPRDGRVGHDKAVDASRHGRFRNIALLLLIQVRRHFDQERQRLILLLDGVPCRDGGRHELQDRRLLLQVPQPRRVGTGHVHHDVVCEGSQLPDTRAIVRGCVLLRLVLAHVDPQHRLAELVVAQEALHLQAMLHGLVAFAVEAVAIDHGLVLTQAEHARFGIARLRQRRHGSDLDKAEAQLGEASQGLRMLVEARRQAHAVGKVHAPHLDLKRLVVDHGVLGRQTQRGGLDGQVVRLLGVHQAQ